MLCGPCNDNNVCTWLRDLRGWRCCVMFWLQFACATLETPAFGHKFVAADRALGHILLRISLADRAWGRSRLHFRLPPLALFSETDNHLKRTGKFPYQNNIGNLPFSWHPCPACCCYFLIQHPTTSLIAGISPWLFLASKAARSPSLGPVRCAGSGIWEHYRPLDTMWRMLMKSGCIIVNDIIIMLTLKRLLETQALVSQHRMAEDALVHKNTVKQEMFHSSLSYFVSPFCIILYIALISFRNTKQCSVPIYCVYEFLNILCLFCLFYKNYKSVSKLS